MENTSGNTTASSSKWCNLPSDILLLISKKLDGKYDRQLCAVCTSWNSSLPSKPRSCFPLEIPYPFIPTEEDDKEQVIYFLKRFKFYIVQRSVVLISPLKDVDTPAAWIAKVEENGVMEKAFFDPLTGNRISSCHCNDYRNQNVSTLFPKYINLLDYCLTDITKAYTILWVDMEGCCHTHSCSPSELSHALHIKKVITCNYYGESVIVLLALLDDRGLAFWKSGFQEWKMVDSLQPHICKLVDIICFDGKFCAVDLLGNLTMIDPLTLKPIYKVVAKLCDPWYDPLMSEYAHIIATYLVRCVESLYLVRIVFNDERLNDSQWYEFDMLCSVYTEEGWVGKGGFGPKRDDVLFLGNDVTYSLSAKHLGWPRGNFAYYGGMLQDTVNYISCGKFDLFVNMCSIPNNCPCDGVYDYNNHSFMQLETKLDNYLSVTRIFCPPVRIIL